MKEITVNKKATFNYEILEKFEAGIVLTGSEIKSIRAGKFSLKDSFVTIYNGEAFLKNSHIAIYKEATYNNHDEYRERKLLLHKHEITKLFSKCKLNGLTLIPLKAYFSNGRVKLEIALAKGKTLHDKRLDDKIKTMEKEAKKALKR